MLRTHWLRFFPILSVLILILAFTAASLAQAPSQQPGSARVPLPKLPTPAKKDRSGLPPIPTFKDVATDVGLTAVHIAAPEAHYVIDSTSGGAGLFDCDDDGRLAVVLVNGSTVEPSKARGDPLVTSYSQEAGGPLTRIPQDAR